MSQHTHDIKQISELAKESQKVIFVTGIFNIVHPGHLRLLKFAKECGDILVVGVIKTGMSQEIIESQYRLEGIQSIGFVDYAFILNEPIEDFIVQLKPYAIVKGKEHELNYNPEISILESYGGKLIFGSGDIIFSSSDLLSKEFNELNFSTIKKPKDFPIRHNFTMESIKEILDSFKRLKVCVIGDTIVDEYINCNALGMSQEDPTIVVTPIKSDMYVGGAAIVAAHAKSLGANVTFFSLAGEDAAYKFVSGRLDDMGIQAYFFLDESRPTTLKQRYRAESKTLLRVSHLRQHEMSTELIDKMFNQFKQLANNFDLLIFSDFNYGCLPQSLVEKISELCKKNGVMMVADSQSSSQIGDVSRFKGMQFLTPTEREARLATREFGMGLVVLAEELRVKANAKNIFITLGSDGLLIHAELSSKNQWLTDRLPAFNTAPKDTAGSGDSFLTAASMSSAVGGNIWQSAYIGSLAAACQVGRVGNIPLRPEEILKEIEI
ncbi:MAG: PfkB family carbohydrate kinase [Leptospira sp.]|nr:PfkB family carbohydrate kinase [Leptospira sp.]